PSAQLARRGGQRARRRGGAPAPRQVLHPRTFRSAKPGSREDRRPLARAAGHARVSVHLQPAAAEGVVDRWLARLVLGGVREGVIARRTPRRWQHDGAGEDRRAISAFEAAYRSPRTLGRREWRYRRRGLPRPTGPAGTRPALD